MLSFNSVNDIYRTGPLLIGKKRTYGNTHTIAERKDIVTFALKHNVKKACKKFHVCQSTLGTWITDHNKEGY